MTLILVSTNPLLV